MMSEGGGGATTTRREHALRPIDRGSPSRAPGCPPALPGGRGRPCGDHRLLDGRRLRTGARTAQLRFAPTRRTRACRPLSEPDDDDDDEERPRVCLGDASRPGSSMWGMKARRSSSRLKRAPAGMRVSRSSRRSTYLSFSYGSIPMGSLSQSSSRVAKVCRPGFGEPDAARFAREGAAVIRRPPALPPDSEEEDSEEEAAAWCGLGWSVYQTIGLCTRSSRYPPIPGNAWIR